MYYLDQESYLEKHYKNNRVKIYHSSKPTYLKLGILHTCGTVTQISGSQIGVEIDGMKNDASAKGIFWFTKSELRLLDDNKGEDIMTGYKNIAVVNLLEDYNHKDYYFAIYDEELNAMTGKLVVVNARGKDKRVLGIVKDVIPAENYGKIVTAQVVAVVDETNYNARLVEEERLKEIAKKRLPLKKSSKKKLLREKRLNSMKRWLKSIKIIRDWLSL